jgi:hypothetical protein
MGNTILLYLSMSDAFMPNRRCGGAGGGPGAGAGGATGGGGTPEHNKFVDYLYYSRIYVMLIWTKSFYHKINYRQAVQGKFP